MAFQKTKKSHDCYDSIDNVLQAPLIHWCRISEPVRSFFDVTLSNMARYRWNVVFFGTFFFAQYFNTIFYFEHHLCEKLLNLFFACIIEARICQLPQSISPNNHVTQHN